MYDATNACFSHAPINVAFYEFWAGWGPGKHTPMLTQVIVRYVPKEVAIFILAWLDIQFFCCGYFSVAYTSSLNTK